MNNQTADRCDAQSGLPQLVKKLTFGDFAVKTILKKGIANKPI